MITIPGYHITEQIYESFKTQVYRGYREDDRSPMVFKLLREEYALSEELARYRHEYQMICSLNLAGIVRACDLQTYHHTLVLLLEDFGGDSLERLLPNRKMALEDFLSLAVQVTNIVGALHRQNIIHKDLGPSNILWNPLTSDFRIIDFGLATVLSREKPTLTNPEELEGTLAYMSPEQTGRMNRSIDYRTDFYALGVTFYELLTGQLPFESDDPIELVHAHIAKAPPAPHKVNSAVPAALSAIVMKLLAKTAEERYQSAEGLRVDLEEYARQLNQSGQIDVFPLGQHDVSGRFQIPEKLYGREGDIERLLQMFDHATAGNTGVVLCRGEPGSGKSVLITEIYKPIVERRGYCIAGKYDQFKRAIPYTAVAQAFQDFARQILTEGETRLNQWKTELLQAVGNNGQVIIDVIPELELVIGPQAEVPPLPATEAQNRFQYVFQNFVHAITHHHPLVVVLDDLHWADSASLNLLKELTADREKQHLLLIGAYRDNELDVAHSLLPALEAIKRSQAMVSVITLEPLAFEHVCELIADTLHCTSTYARPLAELVYEKTQGNSFFVHQFLTSLFDERLIIFNSKQAVWQWDTQQIRARNVTDNVIAFMAGKIQKLPEATQQVLRLAACIGSRFELQTLASIHEHTSGETFGQLWLALVEGLVVPLDDHYKLIGTVEEHEAAIQSHFRFVHDRVQQAAYGLIPQAEQQALHLSIGRMLLATRSELASGAQLFDIVDHFNHGLDLLTDPADRSRVAELNLKAGQKAKAAVAYDTALRYLTTGISVLSADSWITAYQLSFDLHIEQAECAYLLGNFEQAAAVFDCALSRATTPRERASIFNLLVILNNNQGKLKEAVEYGKQGLAALGVVLPDDADEKKAAVGQELATIHARLAGMDIEDLVNLPKLNDPDKSNIMELCANLLPPSYMIGDPDLYTLLILTMVSQSLLLGNSSLSSHAYIMYGVMLNIGFEDFAAAYRFGELGLKLGQTYQNASIDTKNYFAFATWLNPWRQHLKTNAGYFRLAYSLGLESGDMTFAAYAIANYLQTEIHRGERLDLVYQETITYLPFVEKTKDDASIKAVLFSRQFLLCLKGQTQEKDRLDDDRYDEDAQVAELRANSSLTVLGYYLLDKLILLYLYEDYSAALKVAEEGRPVTGGNTFVSMAFLLYDSLTLTALYASLPVTDQQAALETLAARQAQMQTWAEQNPDNYRHIYLLVSAERARVESRDLEAMARYDQAIQAAHDNEYLHHEALANELAAKFYLARGQAKIAGLYITEAHYLYSLWGATRKVQALEEIYPRWLAKTAERAQTRLTPSTRDAAGAKLDLATVLKASQAISSEIDFDKLLARLIQIALQSAGAERGYLALPIDGSLRIEAQGTIEMQDSSVRQSLPLEEAPQPAPAIIQYVARTHEAVVLGDAAEERMFTANLDVQAHRPKSVLCVPILHTSNLTGVLYLENNLVADAFPPDRLEVLTLLASQMAISIENARLYANLEMQTDQVKAANLSLQHEVAERKRLESELLQAQKIESIGRLAGGIAHDFNNLLTAILGYTSLILDELDDTAPIRQEVQAIERAGERAASLTHQLLAFSRQQVLQPQVLELNTLVADLSVMLRRLIGEDIALITLLGSDVGLVQADPSQLEQVVLNLALNARDAMPDGGTLRIETASVDLDDGETHQHVGVKPGRYVRLAISDTGHGIDAESQSRIFEPFFTTKDVGKGTGLGLAMVHGIVHQSGGHISVSSQVGHGSTFTIYLPHVSGHEIIPQPRTSGAAAPIGSETILLVEDDAGVRELVGRMVRTYGYTVLEAPDGIAAQKVAQQHAGSIDLVITDVIMPGGLSGVGLVEAIANQRPQIKVLYMSGYTDDMIAHHGVLESGQGFLQKPFTPEMLMRKVDEILKRTAPEEDASSKRTSSEPSGVE
jgi:predicted ATPase/signal transduction histidine kinase/tRNA A-37 threonylcarbamoyl transferase component Bud32/ActR/RegA family two-component response regulator